MKFVLCKNGDPENITSNTCYLDGLNNVIKCLGKRDNGNTILYVFLSGPPKYCHDFHDLSACEEMDRETFIQLTRHRKVLNEAEIL